MKLALITDWKGFGVVDNYDLSYHLVLAQYVLEGFKYSDFYSAKSEQGDFILMDNGAAEDGAINVQLLAEAISKVHPDEVILPDVMCDAEKTITTSFNEEVLSLIPPRQRAICPQGDTFDEWLACANYFVENMDFMTMCIPKHLERFPGGRPKVLEAVEKLGWHMYYNIHLLGIWGDPKPELQALQKAAPWARGLDTAVPFALAQHGHTLNQKDLGHISHVWGKSFDRTCANINVQEILNIISWRIK